MIKNKLFDNFNKIDTQFWEDLIYKDLKGEDYDKKLLFNTIENIIIKPYYRHENLKGISFLHSQPGKYPFLRGNDSIPVKHKIRQNIFVDKFSDANAKAIDIINKGITSIGFVINKKNDFSKNELFILLSGINLKEVEVNFISASLSQDVTEYCSDYISQYYKDFNILGCSVDFDPLGHKTIFGSFFDTNRQGHKDILQDILKTVMKIPNFKIININAANFRNAGSSAVQELAYGLSIGNYYLSIAGDLGIEIEQIAPRMMFTFGIGSNYFMEIAKIRAARLLWAKIIQAYEVKNLDSTKIYIHSVTTDWNKTAYDPYVNVLRATTEAMSAIIGGTNSLLVKPFNSSFSHSDDFSERIARNTQIILNEEAYFDKFIDPAGGAYYIENLTNSLIENSWALFLQIEQQGGYNEAFDKGIIKKDIELTAAKRDMAIAQKKEVLLGTNQYSARGEKVNITKKNNKQVGKNALRLYRGAEAFEELREKTEKANVIPKVLLLKYGVLAMRKARASFVSNFFACAGFEIIDADAINTVEEGIKLVNSTNAEITVLCSSDDEYIKIASDIFKNKNNNSIIVVAGYPKKYIESIKEIGIKDFIHVKSNILETLSNFQDILFNK